MTVRPTEAKPRSTPTAKRQRTGWSPNMEQRAAKNARQVKCLIASAGHMWMVSDFDRLPAAVRHRLADSAFNICPACLREEARRIEHKPSIATYIAVIAAIEQELREGEPA